MSLGQGGVSGALKGRAVSFYYQCGATESVIQCPGSLTALCVVPNLPPVTQADCPPHAKEDAFSTKAGHPLVPVPFHL